MITIIRGDTYNFNFKRVTADGEVITDLPSKMYFTIKETSLPDEYIFQKTLENGITYDKDTNIYTISIIPSDTDNLKFGKYTYDIEIIENDGTKKTITKGNLKLSEEVTFAGNEG